MAKIGGCKKEGRTKKKREVRLKPLSQFVRGIISAEVYFNLTEQRKK